LTKKTEGRKSRDTVPLSVEMVGRLLNKKNVEMVGRLLNKKKENTIGPTDGIYCYKINAHFPSQFTGPYICRDLVVYSLRSATAECHREVAAPCLRLPSWPPYTVLPTSLTSFLPDQRKIQPLAIKIRSYITYMYLR
jgi:hypothetical protein